MGKSAGRAPLLLVAALLTLACAAPARPSAAAPAAGPAALAPAAGTVPTTPVAAASPATAAPTAPDPLRVVHVIRNGAMGPLWIAYEEGIFAQQGIAAELWYIASGTLGMQALLAKEVDIGVIAASSAVAANLNGADAIYVGAIQRTFVLWLYALPEIGTAAELRVLAKYLETDDPAILNEVYDLYAGRLVQDVPRATYAGTRTLLADLAAQYDQAREVDPARFLDVSFVEALER
ncbi:MAG TPA: ABC transporter substrate-binding protein [Chloroflexota bacterium]|jgi:hypothetical protein